MEEVGSDALLLDVGGAAVEIKIDSAAALHINSWREIGRVVADDLPGSASLSGFGI